MLFKQFCSSFGTSLLPSILRLFRSILSISIFFPKIIFYTSFPHLAQAIVALFLPYFFFSIFPLISFIQLLLTIFKRFIILIQCDTLKLVFDSYMFFFSRDNGLIAFVSGGGLIAEACVMALQFIQYSNRNNFFKYKTPFSRYCNCYGVVCVVWKRVN